MRLFNLRRDFSECFCSLCRSMHSLRTPFSQICLPSARISSCASARHCQIILRPESCKYGLPFPDAWTFALRKSAIGELNRCLRGHPQLGEAQRSCWTVGHIVWWFGFTLSKRLDSRSGTQVVGENCRLWRLCNMSLPRNWN